MGERPTWDEYFMNMVELIKSRSTCLRRQVGALIVRDKMILSTGYNGAPKGCAHCGEVGCLREQLHIPSGERHELCRAVHAEQNAIAQAAACGVNISGATLYTSLIPCSLCTKLIINAGITKVVCKGHYADNLTIPLLREAGVALINLDSDIDDHSMNWVGYNEDTGMIGLSAVHEGQRLLISGPYDVMKTIIRDRLQYSESDIPIIPEEAASYAIVHGGFKIVHINSVDEWLEKYHYAGAQQIE